MTGEPGTERTLKESTRRYLNGLLDGVEAHAKAIELREIAHRLEKCSDELDALMRLFSERLTERLFERFKERIIKLGI